MGHAFIEFYLVKRKKKRGEHDPDGFVSIRADTIYAIRPVWDANGDCEGCFVYAGNERFLCEILPDQFYNTMREKIV